MASKAGPAPWSEGYKRTNKFLNLLHGVEWSLNSGYRQKKSAWDHEPKKPAMRKLKLYNGRTVEVPVDDFQDFIGHFASPPSDPAGEVARYIEKAWAAENKQEVDGVGHISDIIYSPRYQMMWVGFENNGAVVVFFRVPKEVYSELAHLAIDKGTSISLVDGTQRHDLGMRFWDIVRIRGQREGSRYRYQYAIEGERKGSRFSQDIAKTGPLKHGDTDEEIYDGLAKGHFIGKDLDEYRALKSVKDKAAWLRKRNIL